MTDFSNNEEKVERNWLTDWIWEEGSMKRSLLQTQLSGRGWLGWMVNQLAKTKNYSVKICLK